MTDSRYPQDKLARDESRRGFIRGSSLLLAGALPSAAIAAVAPNSSPQLTTASTRVLKVGLIGCGYQGIATVNDLLNAAEAGAFDSTLPPTGNSALATSLQLIALADAFPDRLQQALRTLRGRHGELVQVDGNSRFSGLNACQDLLATDVDLVLLAAPTCFRPRHFEQAIAAGKHVYAESPIAVDSSGVERFQQANSNAIALKRVVGIGLSHRQHPRYQQTIERLQGGAIGKLQSLHMHYRTRTARKFAAANSHSELDTQLRNWHHYPWASGGSDLEQWAMSLDVVNWLLQSHPLAAWCSPTDHSVEFTYAGGIKLQCLSEDSRQHPSKRGQLVVLGAEGWCDLAAGTIFDSKGAEVWQANDDLGEGFSSRKWASVISAIWGAEVWNQGTAAIECTLAAILGRTAASSDRPVTWDDCLQSREVFDCITPTTANLGVDRNATIERYLAGWNK